jgi:hypothetical protein
LIKQKPCQENPASCNNAVIIGKIPPEKKAAVKHNEADLLLPDKIMKVRIYSLQAYRQIEEIRPRQEAVIVSGFAATDLSKMVQSMGVDSLVMNPYIRERIGLVVRKELDRK